MEKKIILNEEEKQNDTDWHRVYTKSIDFYIIGHLVCCLLLTHIPFDLPSLFFTLSFIFSLSLFLCFSIAPFPLSLTLYFTLLTLHLSLVDYLVNATRFSICFVSPPSSWFDKKNYLRSLAVALSLSLVLKHGRAEEKEIRTKLWLIPFVDIICFKSIRIYSLLFLSFHARKKTGRKNVFFFFLM